LPRQLDVSDEIFDYTNGLERARAADEESLRRKFALFDNTAIEQLGLTEDQLV